MEGGVDDSGVPFVILEAGGSEWKATIDTGFNGDLELPLDLFTYVNPRFFATANSLLAGGQSIEEDNYIVDFPFDGQVFRALATFVSGDGILIGTNMLREYALNIDFPSGRLLLERSI